MTALTAPLSRLKVRPCRASAEAAMVYVTPKTFNTLHALQLLVYARVYSQR